MNNDLMTVKGKDVKYRQWKVNDPKAVVLMVYGLGAHSDRWDFAAEYLSKERYSSYAVELKGYGETKDEPRGHIDNFKIYYKDILALVDLIRDENPGKKIFILGESMGGLISFMVGALYPDRLSGAMLISPAFKNGMRFSVMEYLSIFASLVYNPKKQFKMPFTSAMCTGDYEYRKRMEKDPRESRVATSKMLWNILIEQIKAKKLAKTFKLPVLFLISGVDMLVDKRESYKVFDLIMGDKKLNCYSGMFHALSIEKGRGKVFEDIINWLKERV